MFFLLESRSVRLVVALAALLLPAASFAQLSPDDTYQVTRIHEPFQPVGPGATDLLAQIGPADTASTTVQLPFPFRFFGNVYTSASVGHKGFIVFGGGTAGTITNQSLPSTTVPNNLIAAWWDDGDCDTANNPAAYIRSEIRGTAPTREFVIEWNCYIFGNSTKTWNAQIRLLEGSSTIYTSYGAIAAGQSFTATMGIENSTATVAYNGLTPSGGTCAASCSVGDWESDTTIIYSQGPDVAVPIVNVPPVGYAGLPLDLSAVASNIGGELAEQVTVRFWVSRNPTLEPDVDAFLGYAVEVADIVAGQSATFTLRATLPADLAPGPYYILAEGDPDNRVEEGSEDNNLGISPVFQVDAPAPDLSVGGLVVPAEATIGVPFPVAFDVINGGNEVAPSVEWAVVLANDDLVSAADFRIATGRATVLPLDAERIEVEVVLPDDVWPETYRIGVLVDPDVLVPEIDEFNNWALADAPIVVHGRTLSIATTELPPATVGTPWSILLVANGGEGNYRWSLIDGELPPGIRLQEEMVGDRVVATLLTGQAGRIGSWDFTLQVESAGEVAEQDYTLAVIADGAALTVTTHVLPEALLGQPFGGALSAVGGMLPYQWTVVNGQLPNGVVLLPDGHFSGSPKSDGTYPITVEVTDAEGTRARATLELVVRAGNDIDCLTDRLPTKKLDEAYDVTLQAAGGTAPYRWTTLESRLLADATDPGQTWVGREPDGLSLSLDGRVSGTPVKAGRYLWLVNVQGAEGGSGDRCSIVFEVVSDSAPTIVTTHLATAYAGTPYEVDLSAIGGQAPFTWTLGADTELPDGMELTPDGTLRGVVALSALEGRSSRTWDLTIVARDARHRATSTSLALTVRDERQVWEEREIPGPREVSKCQAGGGGAGLLGLLALLAWRAPRRRNYPR